jgi:hypothetical protein
MMTSRERVHRAINHQKPDRIPLDLGGCSVTGMRVVPAEVGAPSRGDQISAWDRQCRDQVQLRMTFAASPAFITAKAWWNSS